MAEGEDRVLVVSPDGVGGTIDRAQLPAALARGFRVEAPEETRERELQREYGDAPVRTAVEGALSSATFGLSDAIIGGVDAEGLEQRRARNPGAALVGNVAGVFVPGGAGSLVAKAGKAAAARIAPAAARLAEGGAVARAAGKALPTVTQGVTEGALYGGGQSAVKVALSDDPLTVERVFSEIGQGMWDGTKWGAVGGLGGAGVEAIATGGRALVGKGRAALAERQAAKAAASAPKAAPTPSITDEAFEAVTAKPPTRVGAADDAVKAELGEARAAAQAERAAVTEAQTAAQAKALGESDEAVKAWQAKAEGVAPRFREKFESMDTEAARLLKWSEKAAATTDDVARVEAITAARSELAAARAANREGLGFDRVETAQVGKRGKELARKGPKAYTWTRADDEIMQLAGTGESRAAIQRQEAALANLRKAVDGKELAPINPLAVLDEAKPPTVDVDALMTQAAASVPTENLAKFEARVAQLEPLVGPGSRQAAKLEHAKKVIASAESAGMTATREQIEAAAKAAGYDLPFGQLPANAQTAITAQYYQATAKAMRKADRAAAAAARAEGRALQAAPASGGFASEAMGAAAGVATDWLVGGLLGPVVSGLLGGRLGRVLKDSLFAGTSGKLAEKAMQVGEKAAKSVDAILRGAQKSAAYVPRTARAVLQSAQVNPREPDEGKGKSLADAYRATSASLARAVADEMGTRAAIAANLAHATASEPALGARLEQRAVDRLAFLASKMPKDPGLGPSIGRQSTYRPSDAEMSRWARYVAAADDPIGALTDEMTAGALSLETVETVETLYPAIYADVQTQLIERAGQLQVELSWPQRLTLSTFFGVPVDSVMRPEMVAMLQSNYAPSDPPDTNSKGFAPSRLGSAPTPAPTEAQRLSG